MGKSFCLGNPRHGKMPSALRPHYPSPEGSEDAQVAQRDTERDQGPFPSGFMTGAPRGHLSDRPRALGAPAAAFHQARSLLPSRGPTLRIPSGTSRTPGPPHPSPGTSRSFSPRACSWLAKLTNSSSQLLPPGSGRFRRSLASARRAARSSRLRSASALRPPLPGRLLAACFRDMAAAHGPPRKEPEREPQSAGPQPQPATRRSGGAGTAPRRRRHGHCAGAVAWHPGHVVVAPPPGGLGRQAP